jgi:hypothetical protein
MQLGRTGREQVNRLRYAAGLPSDDDDLRNALTHTQTLLPSSRSLTSYNGHSCPCADEAQLLSHTHTSR